MREGTEETHAITQLLLAFGEGDEEAFAELVPKVYSQLKRIARGQLRRGNTMSSTELVHESWFKLADSHGIAWESRGHFFAIAARAMRQILVDRARERMALKRGAGESPETFDEENSDSFKEHEQAEALLALHEALGRLSAIDERLSRVVECRFFAGLTTEETAEALDVTVRTVGRDWVKARALLRAMLGSTAELFTTA